MNKFKTLSALTLTSTLLLGVIPVFADDNAEIKNNLSTDTDAEITFEAGSEESVVIPPEENPSVIIPPVGPETGGDLSIMYAPTINFGTQAISSSDTFYDMLAEWQFTSDENGEATDEEVPYVSFAQVQDRRGTNEGWTLSVTASEFTADTHNDTIRGARLHFWGSTLEYNGDTRNEPSIEAVNFSLVPNQSTPILVAADTKGAGTSSIVWGNQEDLMKQFENDENSVTRDDSEGTDKDPITNDAIQLWVPGSATVDATTYTATLTWQLVAGVSNQ